MYSSTFYFFNLLSLTSGKLFVLLYFFLLDTGGQLSFSYFKRYCSLTTDTKTTPILKLKYNHHIISHAKQLELTV